MALNIAKHRPLLYKLLIAISKSKRGNVLGFKWGTLAYFLYNLPRFSTDLDFDLLGEVDEQLLLADLQEICSAYGTVRDSHNKEHTLFLLLDYGKNEMNVKIEINKRTRKNDHFTFKSIWGNQVLCMELEDVFTNKLVALLERKRTVSRDLFDVHFFLMNAVQINEALLMERTGKSTKEYLQEVRDFITRYFTPDLLLAGLGEVITNKQKARVKAHLIEETINQLDMVIAFWGK